MTSEAVEGSRLYSTFSLRSPLPRGKTDYDNIAWKIGQDDPIDENGIRKGSSTVTEKSSATLTVRPPASFLFRMYIACRVLRLAAETKFTAMVLLHRYVQAKQKAAAFATSTTESLEDWPWIGAICLFLACKAEDEPRRLRDIINMAQMVLSSSNTTSAARNDRGDKGVKIATNSTIGNDRDSFIVMDMVHTPPLDGDYWNHKKKAIETEQMVLRWLGFDCSVSHPHRAVYWILERLITVEGPTSHPQESQHQQSLGSSEPADERKNLESLPVISKKRKHDDDTIEAYDGGNDCDKNNGVIIESNNICIKRENFVRDELLSLSFRRLNDALFYPRALQWGVVEMACAAIDLAVVDGFDQVTDHNATDGKAAAVVIEATTEQLQDSNHDLDGKTIYNSFNSMKLIFKHEWWTLYDVSNKDFDDCRNNLKEATRYLRTMTLTKR